MDANGYRAQLGRLGLTQGAGARLVGVDARSSRRWALGEIPVPGAVERLLWACEQFPALLEALQRWPGAAEKDASQ